MSCEGMRCSITYGGVENFAADVSIVSAKKVRINIRTGEEEPATEENVPPASLDRELMNDLRRSLRRFVYSLDQCDAGCYCASFGRVVERTETITFPMYVPRREKKADVWIDLDGRNSDEVQRRVELGQEKALESDTGKPYDFDPDHDSVGDTLVNCCGNIVLEMSIMNTYRYTLEIKAKLKLGTEAGECKRVPGLEGEVV